MLRSRGSLSGSTIMQPVAVPLGVAPHLQKVLGNAVGNSACRVLHRGAREARVPDRRLDLRIAQQPPRHGKASASANAPVAYE